MCFLTKSGFGLSTRHIHDNVASSSSSNIRSSLIGMGFSPSLVDKVIEEKGEDNVDLLLETLFAYSVSEYFCEPDVFDVDNDDRRASLLMMNFSLDEVNFAMDKLGEDAPISELVDFIFAAQIAENQVHDNPNHGNGERNKVLMILSLCIIYITTESLFGTMDKTLRLLELGFSENQISAAIEKYGTEVPITELADAICADEVGDTCSAANKVLVLLVS
ncbi:hypothetical protein CsSME_00021393 [Camellia sinensis var. sinensis]